MPKSVIKTQFNTQSPTLTPMQVYNPQATKLSHKSITGAKDFADGKAIAPKSLQVLITHQRAKLVKEK
jgi:hypothetical protein